jgi:fumarate hydratase subunit beta
MASYTLTTPIPDEAIRQLRAGDTVYLNGVIITGRDAAHKFMVESFIKSDAIAAEEAALYAQLKQLLDGGVIYHCGPVVRQDEAGKWHFVAAGPTTSIREEVYQADVIHHFNLKGVIGKGGMAGRTLQACMEQPAVYLHAIGGAGTLIAQAVADVQDVLKLEFGVPEAMWVIDVKDFPVVVTMDSHGASIHDQVEAASKVKFEALLA